ncbi:DgyrCDS2564 [Dimorphilus gyrociliatus]|uniref:DgyrCDS2564 n=1 Tax=Dimorphilus gyrociliatus TaxID=2664684 RepID=A0A7I8VAP3_9ANNE|nr:DgyrCDS2564 [Dimorphilus gyrociliatus]
MSDDQAPSTENGGGGDVETVEKSEDHKKLVDFGLDTTVADELEKLFQAKLVTYDDLDPRALEAIRDFPIECAIAVLKQLLADSNLQHVNNKSAYICGVMKTYRQKQSLGEDKPAVTNGPDEKKLKEILDRTGYALEITTGQRKYGGPPPSWDGGPPGNGHECFVGRIPKTVYEDDLIPVFEKFGTIWDLRLMMNPMQGCNRGYAFVTFTTAEAAREAAKQLNNYEIKPNKKLQVNVSIANVRLFVGNIPKNKSREDILEEFKKLTEGLREVIVYAFPDDPKKKNRGFAFLEYDTHKSASGAKRKLASGRIRVWGSEIIVDWADPQDEPDEETMAKVKVLYVRNLRSNVTEEELKKIFEPFGEIERVKKVKDYGFVHYKERDSTLSALEAMNGYKLHEVEINVTLAKPANENKARERRMRRERDNNMNMGYDDYYSSYPPASFGPPPPMMRGRIARGGMRGRGGMMRPPAPMDYYDDYSGYGQGYGYDDYSSYGGCYEDFSAEYSPHPVTPQPPHRGRGRGGHHAPAPVAWTSNAAAAWPPWYAQRSGGYGTAWRGQSWHQ